MRTPALLLAILVLALTASAQTPQPIILETSLFRYAIAPDARNVAFVERASGTDYLRKDASSPCALIRTQGQTHAATAA